MIQITAADLLNLSGIEQSKSSAMRAIKGNAYSIRGSKVKMDSIFDISESLHTELKKNKENETEPIELGCFLTYNQTNSRSKIIQNIIFQTKSFDLHEIENDIIADIISDVFIVKFGKKKVFIIDL